MTRSLRGLVSKPDTSKSKSVKPPVHVRKQISIDNDVPQQYFKGHLATPRVIAEESIPMPYNTTTVLFPSSERYSTEGGYYDKVKKTKYKIKWNTDFRTARSEFTQSRHKDCGNEWLEIRADEDNYISCYHVVIKNQLRTHTKICTVFYNLDGNCNYTAVRVSGIIEDYLYCVGWLKGLTESITGQQYLRGTNRCIKETKSKKTAKPGRKERLLNKINKY